MLPQYESVSYELMRPEQVRAARERATIVYLPAGSLEWHGRHNPLGVDSIKAHAICCEAALMTGGVVLPPYYLGLLGDLNWGPEGWDGFSLGYNQEQAFQAVMDGICKALALAGWRVIVGVTGHDVDAQRDCLARAIARATDGVRSSGFAVMEGEMHSPDAEIPLKMDHAGAWETSCMLHACPDKVNLAVLSDSPQADDDVLTVEWATHRFGPEGIDGWNPLKHATPDMGRRIVRSMGKAIGDRAMETLARLESCEN